MITIADIKKAVVSVLKKNGYTVTATEVQEGFWNRMSCSYKKRICWFADFEKRFNAQGRNQQRHD